MRPLGDARDDAEEPAAADARPLVPDATTTGPDDDEPAPTEVEPGEAEPASDATEPDVADPALAEPDLASPELAESDSPEPPIIDASSSDATSSDATGTDETDTDETGTDASGSAATGRGATGPDASDSTEPAALADTDADSADADPTDADFVEADPGDATEVDAADVHGPDDVADWREDTAAPTRTLIAWEEADPASSDTTHLLAGRLLDPPAPEHPARGTASIPGYTPEPAGAVYGDFDNSLANDFEDDYLADEFDPVDDYPTDFDAADEFDPVDDEDEFEPVAVANRRPAGGWRPPRQRERSRHPATLITVALITVVAVVGTLGYIWLEYGPQNEGQTASLAGEVQRTAPATPTSTAAGAPAVPAPSASASTPPAGAGTGNDLEAVSDDLTISAVILGGGLVQMREQLEWTPHQVPAAMPLLLPGLVSGPGMPAGGAVHPKATNLSASLDGTPLPTGTPDSTNSWLLHSFPTAPGRHRLELQYTVSGAVLPGGSGTSTVVFQPLLVGYASTVPIRLDITGATVWTTYCRGGTMTPAVCGNRSPNGWTVQQETGEGAVLRTVIVRAGL